MYPSPPVRDDGLSSLYRRRRRAPCSLVFVPPPCSGGKKTVRQIDYRFPSAAAAPPPKPHRIHNIMSSSRIEYSEKYADEENEYR